MGEKSEDRLEYFVRQGHWAVSLDTIAQKDVVNESARQVL